MAAPSTSAPYSSSAVHFLVEDGGSYAYMTGEDQGPGAGDTRRVMHRGTGEVYEVAVEDVHKANPEKYFQADYIAILPNLNKGAAMQVIKDRYADSHCPLIHTYSGLFIVIVNPYKMLPIYGPDAMAAYRGDRSRGQNPHIFAVANRAYMDMLQNDVDQSILCTGESGAGKTVNAKRVIEFIVASQAAVAAPAMDAAASRRATMGVGSLHKQQPRGELEDQLLKANPILETFGNASTSRNDNSSRFGKFIYIRFDGAGSIVGGSIDTYLLEKSRVATQAEGERSFHAFYQLLWGADAETRGRLHLGDMPVDFETPFVNRIQLAAPYSERAEWEQTNAAFAKYGMSPEDIEGVWRTVAGVLLLGELRFECRAAGADEPELVDDVAMQKVASLFGVDPIKLSEKLTRPVMSVGRVQTRRATSVEQIGSEVRALAKFTFEKLFQWIVRRINQSIDVQRARACAKRFIGILDIAGFEIFDVNNYEQLLINFTNEKLQQVFNHHMFKLEQAEYHAEGISWSNVDFALDLEPTIQLIEGPEGVIPLLNDQSILGDNTNDASLVRLFDEKFGRGQRDAFTGKSLRMKGDFAIKHYAGDVVYTADGWLLKNRDPLNKDVESLFQRSGDAFFAGLWAPGKARPARGKGGSKGKLTTVGSNYVTQLGELMATLKATVPHFVRCIKPNHAKKPGIIDERLVEDQLKCGGVLEAIRIVRLGYPNRVKYAEFRRRYAVLVPRSTIGEGFVDSADAVRRMIPEIGLAETEYQFGRTKIFFKAGVQAKLEEQLDDKLRAVLPGLQAYCRTFIAKNAFQFHIGDHKAVAVIQKSARAFLALRANKWWRLYCKIKPQLHDLQRQQEQAAAAQQAEELRTQLAERDATERELRERIAELEAENGLLKEERLECDGIISALEEENAQGQRKFAVLEKELDEADARGDALHEEKLALQKAVAGLEAKVADMAADAAKGDEAQAAAITRLQRMAAEHEEAFAAKVRAARALEEQCAAIPALKAEAEELRSELAAAGTKGAKLEKALSSVRQASEDLQRQVDASRADADKARDAKRQHAEAMRSKDEEIAGATARAAQLEREAQLAGTKVLNLEEEMSTVAAKLAAADKAVARLEADNATLAANDDMKAKCGALQSQLDEKEEALADAEDELDEERTLKIKATRERDALTMKLHQLETQHESEGGEHAQKVRRMQSTIDSQQAETADLASRNTKLSADTLRLQRELEEHQSQSAIEIKSLERKLARATRKADKLKAAAGAEVGGTSTDMPAALQKIRDQYRSQLEEAEATVDSLRRAKVALERDLDEQKVLYQDLEGWKRQKMQQMELDVAADSEDEC